MKNSDKTWSTGRGDDKALQQSCWENSINMKRQKDMTEDQPPKLEGVRQDTGEDWRAITNNYGKNEVVGSKQKQCSVVNVSGCESKVKCCKEKRYTGNRNVRPMNQGKLDTIKQEMARVNINILGISE